MIEAVILIVVLAMAAILFASSSVDLGTGATITFGTSGFTANIENIELPEQVREAVNTSHLGTSGRHTKIPSDLVDSGSMKMTFQFNPDTDPPIDQAAETVTITFPEGATWAFSGFMTNYGGSVPLEGKMMGTATVEITGDISQTAAGGGGSGS